MVHLNSINISSKIWWQSRNNCEISRWWVGQIFINLTDRQQELKSAISIVHRALLEMVHPKASPETQYCLVFFLATCFFLLYCWIFFLASCFFLLKSQALQMTLMAILFVLVGRNFFFFFSIREWGEFSRSNLGKGI